MSFLFCNYLSVGCQIFFIYLNQNKILKQQMQKMWQSSCLIKTYIEEIYTNVKKNYIAILTKSFFILENVIIFISICFYSYINGVIVISSELFFSVLIYSTINIDRLEYYFISLGIYLIFFLKGRLD